MFGLGLQLGRLCQSSNRLCQSREYSAVRELDKRVPRAKPVHGVERGRFAAENNDVVCVAVLWPPGERDGVGLMARAYMLDSTIVYYDDYYFRDVDNGGHPLKLSGRLFPFMVASTSF